MKNKNFVKIILSIFFVFTAALALGAVTTAAKTEEYKVNVDEGAGNYVFYITWENTENSPSVVLTSPGGTVYTADNAPQVTVGEGELTFWFESAEEGTWNVEITGENLGTLTLDAGEVPGKMEITSFDISLSGENAIASWNVTDSAENIEVEIWAAADKVNYGGERVERWSSIEPSASEEFSIRSLDSGDYYFYIKVIGEDGIFNCRYFDERISWREDGIPAKLENVKAYMVDDELWAEWSIPEDCEDFRVMVFDKETGESLFDEVVSETPLWSTAVSQEITSFEVAVAALDGNETGDFEWLTVSPGDFLDVTVTFPEGLIINVPEVNVQVDCSNAYTVSAAINYEMLMEAQAAPGTFTVRMDEGDNQITFYIIDSAGNIKTFGKDYSVDVTAPQLSIMKDLDGLSTDEQTVYLEGHTEQGAVLTLNGDVVTTQNGYFSIPVTLSAGNNKIELISTDTAGNSAYYSADVYQPPVQNNFTLWIVCAAVFVILAVLYLAVFLKGRKKKNEKV